MNWIMKMTSKLSYNIKSLYVRSILSKKEEDMFKDNIMKMDDALIMLYELRELYSKGDEDIGYHMFKEFDLFTPYQILDGLMVVIFKKDANNIYLTAHYAKGTELRFHKHSDAEEVIVHVEGEGKGIILENGIERIFDLAEFQIIRIPPAVEHCFIMESEATSLVKIKKHK